jgi:phage terminase Nu1 subunit (DNA packaging protein)
MWGVAEREVYFKARDGVIPPPVGSQYDIIKCTQAYIAWLKDARDIRTTPEVAKVFGVSESQVQALVREQGMPRERTGIFDLSKCVPWYADKLKRRSLGGDSQPDMYDEKVRLVREQRLRAELTRKEAEGVLVPLDECEAGWITLSGKFRAAVNSLVARLAPGMVNIETPAEAREILLRESRGVLEELADELTSLSKGIRSTGRADRASTAGSDPGSVGGQESATAEGFG